MPKMVDKLTKKEEKLALQIKEKFTEDQICAYFLTKTVRSLYQFDESFIESWYKEIFNRKPKNSVRARKALVEAYAKMLITEHKYKYHLEYWLRQYQEMLIVEMETFFSGEGAK